ncbi:MAG TPA: hypothetical protein VJ464_18915 [Blastocatellia bacterium]|nr:hypothetical protein [Blastocatellia bacterium]
MITGFNTDVQHEGQVYHVQTEDRGHNNPVLESLVYIGGTIVAKKMTPYAEQLSQGADETLIAGLLKRQHQVIIAAIKTGRVRELIAHYASQSSLSEAPSPAPSQDEAKESRAARPKRSSGTHAKRVSGSLSSSHGQPPQRAQSQPQARPPAMRTTSMLGSPRRPEPTPAKPASPMPASPMPAQVTLDTRPTSTTARRATGTLDLDQVINEYMKRNNEQGKLELRVITPSAFIAGKTAGLRVQVLCNAIAEPEAVVTIKIIGTAFKPQVHIGRAGRDGIANFSLSLPSFSAGTAAIVIEAQSNRGRGELKHLIRRA